MDLRFQTPGLARGLALNTGGSTWLKWATWGFVALGVLLRLFRYAVNYPLWGDEACIAANLIGRGYLDLLRPLDFAQVSPPLFLWVEHTIVSIFGFSEYTLRFFPLLCAVASVPLFACVARKVTRGVPLLLAVAIFAVSFHPIRHAAEVKPYASDLLVALALVGLAFAWLGNRERTGRLWLLAACAPLAIVLSFPAVFVAGAVSLALARPVWRTRRWQAWLPLVAFNVAVLAAFGALQLLKTGARNEWDLIGLQAYWARSFPPLENPLALARWLVWVHTGTLFAYPGGGQGGASALTFLLFVVGAWTLRRRGQNAALITLVAPFGLALVAAALRRYPYGGEARQMQFVAPSICLLAGLGAGACLRRIPWPQARLWTLGGLGAASLAAAVAMMAGDLARPYRYLCDYRAREFAREFWPAQAREAEVACLRGDFKILDPFSANQWAAGYLCNQWIYSPSRRTGGPRLQAVSASHPLRCVLYHATPVDGPAVSAWLAAIQTLYELRGCERIVVTLDPAHEPARVRSLLVYEFVPRPVAGPTALVGRKEPGGGAGSAARASSLR